MSYLLARTCWDALYAPPGLKMLTPFEMPKGVKHEARNEAESRGSLPRARESQRRVRVSSRATSPPHALLDGSFSYQITLGNARDISTHLGIALARPKR
jgi:hypothetical protein